MVNQITETVKESHPNDRGCPVKDVWQPEQIVDVGHGCKLGVTTDDGCFVVLYPTEFGQWRLGTHIPGPVAKILGQLAR
ncbi:hypothetical protein ES703_86410 [subsurface metagenome]